MTLSDFGLDAFRLTGRCAVVTGGNTGLGQAFSVALAAAGADVLVPALQPDDGSTRDLVVGHGRRYDELVLDITAPGACRTVVQECVTRFGRLDILVNSAGICLLDEVDAFDRAKWDPMVAVNLTAAFDLAHEASLVMSAAGYGKIVNIASLFSYLGGRSSPAYAATKAGIVGLTRAYCDELAGRGITVNALAPGYFATSITAGTRADPVTNQRVVDHIPAGRWGEVRDLMGALVFLCSPASDYVNGQVLVVDGGYLVR